MCLCGSEDQHSCAIASSHSQALLLLVIHLRSSGNQGSFPSNMLTNSDHWCIAFDMSVNRNQQDVTYNWQTGWVSHVINTLLQNTSWYTIFWWPNILKIVSLWEIKYEIDYFFYHDYYCWGRQENKQTRVITTPI